MMSVLPYLPGLRSGGPPTTAAAAAVAHAQKTKQAPRRQPVRRFVEWLAALRFDICCQFLVLGLVAADFAFDLPILLSLISGGAPGAHEVAAQHSAWSYYKTVVQSPPVNCIVLANVAQTYTTYDH